MGGRCRTESARIARCPSQASSNNEQARPKQKARKLILPADSSADTRRAAVVRDSPSSGEDVSAEILGRTGLPAPKARVPSAEAHRPFSHRRRRAATARTPTQEICLPLEQVPFDDSPSEQGLSAQAPSAQEQFRMVPLAETTSALKSLEHIPMGEGRNADTRVPSAEAPSAVLDRDDIVGPPWAGSPTMLKVLAGYEVEAPAEEAARPSARESPRNPAATKILETEDDTPLEEEEVQSVRGTPTRVLCEQVVPLLRYLDCKVTKISVSYR
ncbi:hypothetical protein AXG93_3131s1000 [Marchantia polymorpha subsp. ruderalis]|uniref:Uncharacterized protein n=1 Tax=Marchantia polymorpha subsp. ruderalis TaxID=1480154 RepID=A0A176WM38_MARPO|nr:hypothetical protein AXG93_3131s1000 [Marchantia polymorpha subsp. ruderalis]